MPVSKTDTPKAQKPCETPSERPKLPSVDFYPENIPDSLKDGKKFLCWTPVWNGSKWKKPPRDPTKPGKEWAFTGYTNPENLSSFEEARISGQYCNWGIGILLHSENNLTGVDLDGCRKPETEAIEEWALEIICRIGGYWEVSPSGEGLHGYVRGSLSEELLGNHDGLEVYEDGRYFTLTGRQVTGTEDYISEDIATAEEVVRDWIDENGHENDGNNSVEATYTGQLEEDLESVERIIDSVPHKACQLTASET